MASILVINGPNLNLLGSREPEIYGYETLEEVNDNLRQICDRSSHNISFLQSNAEHEIIDRLHGSKKQGIDFIIINPAAFTHSSIAIRDALIGIDIPFIEVHISNVHAREDFRKHSYFSDIAQGSIIGLGTKGYELALVAALEKLKKT